MCCNLVGNLIYSSSRCQKVDCFGHHKLLIHLRCHHYIVVGTFKVWRLYSSLKHKSNKHLGRRLHISHRIEICINGTHQITCHFHRRTLHLQQHTYLRKWAGKHLLRSQYIRTSKRIDFYWEISTIVLCNLYKSCYLQLCMCYISCRILISTMSNTRAWNSIPISTSLTKTGFVNKFKVCWSVTW